MKTYILRNLLSCRAQFALCTLALLLQRSPALKLLLNTFQQHAKLPVPRILQSIALPAATLSAPHALCGATTSSYSVDPQNPYSGKVGETVVIGFSINIQPRSWTVVGEVPPGLRITDLRQRVQLQDGLLATSYGLISGTPTTAGSWELTLSPWQNDDGTGDGPPAPLSLTINIAPDDPLPQPEIPKLDVEQNTNALTLRWNATSAYQIESSTDFENWTAIPTIPEIDGNQYRIDFPITNGQIAFFRLAPNNDG